MGQSEWSLLIQIIAVVVVTVLAVRHQPDHEAGRSLGLGLNRMRWFEVILVGYVGLWLFAIWAAGDPPRFFL